MKVAVSDLSSPNFNEDGEYLTAFDDNYLEIIDAHTGHSTHIIEVNKFRSKAIAISKNEACLALVVNEKGEKRTALFEEEMIMKSD